MSFSLYLSCFHNGESAEFPRQMLEDVFRPYIAYKEQKYWQLAFPDWEHLYPGRSHCDIYVKDKPILSGFAVDRPPDNRLFWGVMMDLLLQLPAVIYWDGYGCVVADPAMIHQLPPEMVAALGTPIVVTRMEQIWEAIKRG